MKNIIITILAILVLGLGGYLVYDKVIDKDVKEEEHNDGVDRTLLHAPAVKCDGIYAAGTYSLTYISPGGFKKNYQTGDLQAAAGAARTCAANHNKQKYPPAESRPKHKIFGTEARCANNSGNIEKGVAQTGSEAVSITDGKRDENGCAANDSEKPQKLLIK